LPKHSLKNENEQENMRDIIQPVKGTRDFYPREMAIRNWVYQKAREVSESFGYQEYEGPLLESIDLYAAKSGEELVKEQAFVFPDRSDNLITLRPELTPTLVRMVAQQQQHLYYPLRWWSFGPFWRYESPQKGRTREFFQWNIDLIGEATPETDAELVAIMAAFYQAVGLQPDEIVIAVNNRRLVDRELGKIGIQPEQRSDVFRLIDRKEKLSPEEWRAYALEQGLSEAQFEQLQAMTENQDLWKDWDELVRFFQAVEALGAGDYVRFDPQIIRGLDYYTGTVFEGQTLEADIRRAVAGGGRYDDLLADVGGDPLPGTGFAMGDVVVSILLEELGHLPEDLTKSPAPVIVTVFSEDLLLDTYRLSATLRQEGLKVTTYPTPDKLGKQFRHADRIGARIAVILGPDEKSQGQVAIKNLKTRKQQVVPREEAAQMIQKMLVDEEAS
jgi:histidyl-tRNA synthetase